MSFDVAQVTRRQFKRFLVDSPLVRIEPGERPGACPPSGLGSFHQQYWLDGVQRSDHAGPLVASLQPLGPDEHALSTAARQIEQARNSMLVGDTVHFWPTSSTRAGFNNATPDDWLAAQPDARRCRWEAGSRSHDAAVVCLGAGQLIAVAVVDILPGSLSSKYFFWDPGYAWLSPGRLSALLEIEWVRAAGAACPGLRYYMMGFYIATCPKMSYKVCFAL